MAKEFFGERLHEEYEDVFDFFEIIPSNVNTNMEYESVYICGWIIRVFSFVFITEGVSGLEDGLSFCEVALWENCLEKLNKFLDVKHFDDGVKMLGKKLNSPYEQFQRQILINSKELIEEEKEEIKKVVSQMISWIKLHNGEYNMLTFVDMLH